MSPFCQTAGQEPTALAPNSSSNVEQPPGHFSSAVQLLPVTLMLWGAGGAGAGVLVSAALTVRLVNPLAVEPSSHGWDTV